MFCSKYDSHEKEFNLAHLVVFMNEMRALDKLSADRYLICILTAKDNKVSGPLASTDFIDEVIPRHMLWKDHNGHCVDFTQDGHLEQERDVAVARVNGEGLGVVLGHDESDGQWTNG